LFLITKSENLANTIVYSDLHDDVLYSAICLAPQP
jgi:hypothetical protein